MIPPHLLNPNSILLSDNDPICNPYENQLLADTDPTAIEALHPNDSDPMPSVGSFFESSAEAFILPPLQRVYRSLILPTVPNPTNVTDIIHQLFTINFVYSEYFNPASQPDLKVGDEDIINTNHFDRFFAHKVPIEARIEQLRTDFTILNQVLSQGNPASWRNTQTGDNLKHHVVKILTRNFCGSSPDFFKVELGSLILNFLGNHGVNEHQINNEGLTPAELLKIELDRSSS